MRVHLVLLLVTVWLATSYAGPQRQRQQSPQEESSNPLSMGMKFLGNLRNTMTSAVSGLFRPRSRPTKVRPQRPPPPHQRHPLAPNAPQFHQVPEHVTRGPQNSFFTVVHEDNTVTQRAPAPQSLPLADEHVDDSFQPSSFFSSSEHFQGNFEENIFSAPKRPNDFSFGHLKDDDKISSSFSQGVNIRQGVNTRPTHQNFQSSGFQPGPGLQVVSPPNFPSGNNPSGNNPTAFTAFSRAQPTGFRQSSSSLSSSLISPSSSSVSKSSSSVAKKPLNQLPLQDNHIPEIFTVPDPQRHEPPTNREKFTSEITPAKLKFEHRFTTSRPSTPIRRITPSRISAQTLRPVVRPTRASRLPSAAVPSGPKKPVIPSKSATGDRHVHTGFKQQVVPKDGDKASHISGYEWGYGVKDSGTGNQFFHAEKREEGTTKGSYKISLPDGRIQTVTYIADDKGYHPVITYEGEAIFPDASDRSDVAIGSIV